MKVLMCIVALILFVPSVQAKSYHFDMDHQYEVKIVRVSDQGTKFLLAGGIAGNADKAIIQAQQDAVAACLFTGVEGNPVVGAGKIPAICGGKDVYEANKEYFDKFFKKGEFLDYVKNVNSKYPSGENNVAVKGGRKVRVYVQVMYDELRKKLEADGIVKALNSYF